MGRPTGQVTVPSVQLSVESQGVLGALGCCAGQKLSLLGEHRIWRSVQFWLHLGKVT